MSRYTNVVYIGIHLVLPYIDRLISSVCYFLMLSKIVWVVSANSTILLLTCLDSDTRFIFEDILCHHLWKVHFQLPCFLLALAFWSVNCTSLVYKLYLTFQTCQGTKMSRHNLFLACLETESIFIFEGF